MEPDFDTSAASTPQPADLPDAGALLEAREVVIDEAEWQAFLRSVRTVASASVLRGYLVGLPRNILSQGFRAGGAWPITVFALVVGGVVGLITRSWVPLLVGLFFYPCVVVALACVVPPIALVTRRVRRIRGQRLVELQRISGPGPASVRRYERGVLVRRDETGLWLSGVRDVRRLGPAATQVHLGDGSTCFFPPGLLAVDDVEYVVGGPVTVVGRDGGPTATRSVSWMQTQAAAMPDDDAGSTIARDLDAAIRAGSDEKSLYARWPVAWRYDAVRRRLESVSDGSFIPVARLREVVARAGTVVMATVDRVEVVPAAAFVPQQFDRMLGDLGPSAKVNVDVMFGDRRVLRGAPAGAIERVAAEELRQIDDAARVEAARRRQVEEQVKREADTRIWFTEVDAAAQRSANERVRAATMADALGRSAASAPAAVWRSSQAVPLGRATSALICSVVGLVIFVFGLAAIFLGTTARRTIRESNGRYTGETKANVAIVLGVIGAFWPLTYGIIASVRSW